MSTPIPIALAALSTLVLPTLAPGAAAQVPDFESRSITYDTGSSTLARMPWSMRQADLDGDGLLDVVTVHGPAIPKLGVLFGRGDGSFGPPVLYDTAAGFWDDANDLEVADFDRDGDIDVVVANTGNTGSGSTVSLHRNRGDGSFAPRAVFPAGAGPTGLAAADFDGDGWTDLAVANFGRLGQGSTVSVLTNDRNGGFRPPGSVPVGAGPYRIATGDVDGDGTTDLAVAREGQRVVIIHNTAELTPVSYPVLPNQFAGDFYPCVELADLDLDGDLDVVYSSLKSGFQSGSGRGAVAVLHNDGSGRFGAAVALTTLPETQGAADLAVGDLDLDGWPDIASAHLNDGEWLLFESTGGGAFATPRSLQAGAEAIAIDILDINADARADALVLARFALGLCVYENTVGRRFADPRPYPFTTSGLIVSTSMDSADYDGDGDLDLGLAFSPATSNAGGIGLLANRGDGTFAAPRVLNTPVAARELEFRDLDGDGITDLLWGDDFPPYEVHTRRGLGGGAFAAQRDWQVSGCKIGDVHAFDMDRDGDLDVAVSAAAFCGGGNGQPLFLLHNAGDGTFARVTQHTLSTFTTFVTHADIDNDGIADLVTNSGFNGIEVSLGNGDGTFGTPLTSVTERGPLSIAVADFNRDGNLDLATSNLGQNKGQSTVSVLIGFGDGGFFPAVHYESAYDPALSNARRITAGDIDGDGDLDLMTGNWSSRDVSVYRNRGDGTFDRQLRYGTGDEVFDLVWADVTGDAIEDLVVGIVPGASLSFFPAAAVLPGTAGSAWRNLRSALGGALGAPTLQSATPVVGGQSVQLDLANAAAAAAGVHVLGLQRVDQPLLGGLLVPRPDLLTPFATDPLGASSLTLPIPVGVPTGISLFAQSWILDPTGPSGVTASNALQGTQY